MYDREWLDSLKAGDSVYVSGSYGNVGTIEQVSRTTATQIVLEHTNGVGSKYERRYRRKDGYIVGDSSSYHRSGIHRVTPELIEKIHRKALHDTICVQKWSALPTDKLQRIVAIIQE